MRKSHRADRRHRETRPLDREGGSAGRRHPPAGCARRAPAEELSRACKQRPPTSAARSSSGPAPHLEGMAPAGPHRCPGAVVGAPPGPDGRAAPAEGAPRRRAGQEGEQPRLRPPIFMPASGILQQQLKKMSLGVGEAVAARAPPAFCRRGTPGRGGHTPGAHREHTEPPLRKLHSPERSPKQHFGRLRSGFLRRPRRRATPRRPAAPRWNRLELGLTSA